MSLSLLSGLLAPFIGSVLAIFSSAFSIIASVFTSITPILTGISSFVVWFFQSFFQGLYAITQNINTLTVIITVVVVSLFYLHRLDTTNLIQQVQEQKTYDARHPPHILKPRPQAKKTDNGWDFNIF